MQQTIETVIDGVLQAMRVYGLSESTIHQYYRGFCKPIMKYLHEKGTGNHSKKLLEIYLSEAKSRLEVNQIKQHHYLTISRTIRYLNSYVNSGEVDFTMLVNTRKYCPTNEHLKIITLILDETELQEGFKYRIHCCIRHFFCFIEEHELEINQLHDEDFRRFISEVSDTNKGSMDYIMYAITLIAKYLQRYNLANVITDYHCFLPKSNPVRLIAPYSQNDINKMLQAINPTSLTAKRDRAIVLLTFNTALRGIDIVKLQLSDVDWRACEIKIIQSKTKVPLTLPINGTTLNALADYLLEERPQCIVQSVFVRGYSPFVALKGTSALDGIVERLCQKAEIVKKPYRSFHSIRRALATELSIAEVPLTSISQILGHRDINSDQPYLSFNRQQTSLCSIGFEEITLKKGIYASMQAYYQSGVMDLSVDGPLQRLSCLVVPMSFAKIPLKGVFLHEF
ncbi:MAG: tyrosine-type recombinase/integrase [Peptostreptococcaceae bacterium]|nr:tyrosine-type recombinase/integrase [Peptostreptococcaceae bacterium]